MAIDQTNLTAEQELAELVACTLSDTDLKTQRDRWIFERLPNGSFQS